MVVRKLLTITSMICVLSSCHSSRDRAPPDPRSAAQLVQHTLGIHEPVVGEELRGGLSKAKLYLVTCGDEKYVLRSRISPQTLEDRECLCLQIASDAKYGPHVYYIDPYRRYVIMEYVASAPIFGKDRPSHYYQLLGKTLSTMHNGMSFPKRKGIFQYIENDIHRLEKKSFLHEIVARVHAMLPTIQQALTPVLQEVPCHNDLIPNNILYTGSAFKIIDYEFAEQGDPYFDIATLLEFTCVSPQDEMELLTSYFGRPMRAKEKAKLFLMKQLVRICFMARLFSIFPNSEVDATAKEYCEFLKTNPKAVFDRRFSALYLFTLASKSFETTEFQEALQELSTNEALSS